MENQNKHAESNDDGFNELVRKYHAGQVRAGDIPYYEHCFSVAKAVEQALSEEGQVDANRLRRMILAAKGHDLYEDTDIPSETVVNRYGKDVHDLIKELTNVEGDDDVKDYVEKMKSASEEAKLIKLADLLDNYRSVQNNIAELGRKWIEGWFLKIVEPMYAEMHSVKFSEFPKAAEHLLHSVEKEREALLQKLQEEYNGNMTSLEATSTLEGGMEQEDWDYGSFVEKYNAIADRKGGWHYEENRATNNLEITFRGGSCKTLSEFAEVRFDLEQRS